MPPVAAQDTRTLLPPSFSSRAPSAGDKGFQPAGDEASSGPKRRQRACAGSSGRTWLRRAAARHAESPRCGPRWHLGIRPRQAVVRPPQSQSPADQLASRVRAATGRRTCIGQNRGRRTWSRRPHLLVAAASGRVAASCRSLKRPSWADLLSPRLASNPAHLIIKALPRYLRTDILVRCAVVGSRSPRWKEAGRCRNSLRSQASSKRGSQVAPSCGAQAAVALRTEAICSGHAVSQTAVPALVLETQISYLSVKPA